MKRKSLLFVLLMALFMPFALHAQQSLPYSYGFEDNDLTADGWELQGATSSSTGIVENSNAYEGSFLFRFYYSEENAYLVSPVLSNTSRGLDLSFYYAEYSANYGDEQFQVGYTTDETVTDASAFSYGDVVTASLDWQEYTNSFPAGTKRIAIKYIYNDAFYLWLDNFSFEETPACPKPMNLAADATVTSASISWSGIANSYNLRYRTAVIEDPTFFEDFESGSLDNWTTVRNGEGNANTDWRVINSETTFTSSFPAHSGVYVAMSRSWASTAYNVDNWLITPQVTLNGILKFWVMDDGEYHEHYDVYVSTATNSIDDFTLLYEPGDATSTWTAITVDLSRFGGVSGYIALRHTDNDQDYLFIDDFGIYNVTPAGAWTTVNNVTSPHTINGLTSETSYDVEVQANCGSDGYSEWAGITFSTLPDCIAPSNLTISDITTTSAVVSWTGPDNSTSYTLVVNDREYTGVTSPYSLRGLTANTTYIVEVQTVCGATGASTWTSTSFITPCEAFDVPYTYGFEDNAEINCWSGFSMNSSNSFGISGYDEAYEGEKVFVFSSYYTADDYNQYLISPELNATASVDLEFYYGTTTTSAQEAFTVGYSTTTDDLEAFIWSDTISDVTIEWAYYYQELPAGTKYVAIHYCSVYQYYLLIDAFSVDNHSDCRKPTDFEVSAIGPTTATLSWTENGEATSWVIVREDGGPRPITITTSDNPYTFTGNYALTPETEYTVRVRPVCEENKWSDDVVFFTNNAFMTDGNWNDGSHWYTGSVPAEGSPVTIQANVTIPAGYTAIADEITLDGGSITVADGGQLRHNTDDLEVTMQKNVEPYTNANSTSNYYLVAFPFNDYVEVPETITAFEGTDFYVFDNAEEGQEWQNNQAEPIDEVYGHEGYLYARPVNPTTNDNILSLAGPTYTTPEYGYGHAYDIYYDATENEYPGWSLWGNPFTCDAYIYGNDNSLGLHEMEVMYYDENGDMQTVTCGPIPPMQGFFVKVTEYTELWFLSEHYDLSSKKALQAINHEENVDKAAPVLDKVIFNPSNLLLKKTEYKELKPVKK